LQPKRPTSHCRWRFHLDGQGTWVGQRDSRLAVTGFLAAPQFLELDHHVVPAAKPGRRYRMLRCDDPDTRPGEPTKGVPSGLAEITTRPARQSAATD